MLYIFSKVSKALIIFVSFKDTGGVEGYSYSYSTKILLNLCFTCSFTIITVFLLLFIDKCMLKNLFYFIYAHFCFTVAVNFGQREVLRQPLLGFAE